MEKVNVEIEKLHLKEFFDDIRFLSKRSEFINHYRHHNKPLLKNTAKALILAKVICCSRLRL